MQRFLVFPGPESGLVTIADTVTGKSETIAVPSGPSKPPISVRERPAVAAQMLTRLPLAA